MLEDQTEKGLFYMDERALIMEMEDAVDRLYGEGTYKEALKYHLKAYPEFTKNWLKKAGVNVNDMIDHDHLDEVNTFYDTGNKMMSAYDDKYGVPELKKFLILLENLDDKFFEKEISDKSFSE